MISFLVVWCLTYIFGGVFSNDFLFFVELCWQKLDVPMFRVNMVHTSVEYHANPLLRKAHATQVSFCSLSAFARALARVLSLEPANPISIARILPATMRFLLLPLAKAKKTSQNLQQNQEAICA